MVLTVTVKDSARRQDVVCEVASRSHALVMMPGFAPDDSNAGLAHRCEA